MNDPMARNLARQVKRSRELLADLERPGWQDRMPLPRRIGQLEAQLKLLCDAVEAGR